METDLDELCDEDCRGFRHAFGDADEPTCTSCKKVWLRIKKDLERYDYLDALPVVGQMRRLSRATGDWWRSHTRHRFRSLKWRLAMLLNNHPWSRVFYPIFQVVVLQCVWVVEGWWVIARTDEKAACYWGNAHFGGTTPKQVRVRRILSSKVATFAVDYAGHGEHVATRL